MSKRKPPFGSHTEQISHNSICHGRRNLDHAVYYFQSEECQSNTIITRSRQLRNTHDWSQRGWAVFSMNKLQSICHGEMASSWSSSLLRIVTLRVSQSNGSISSSRWISGKIDVLMAPVWVEVGRKAVHVEMAIQDEQHSSKSFCWQVNLEIGPK